MVQKSLQRAIKQKFAKDHFNKIIPYQRKVLYFVTDCFYKISLKNHLLCFKNSNLNRICLFFKGLKK